MGINIVCNGIAGSGKTSLLQSLGNETLVISRDSKEFPLQIPHMLVDTYYDMTTFLYGADIDDGEGTITHVDGVSDKLQAYESKFGKYPDTVVFDSVSQITMDIIDKASQTPNNYGSQGAEVTKELAMFTKFVHEELELNGFNIVLLNHVIEEKTEGAVTGKLIAFDTGKFAAKGGYYATVNEAVTIIVEGVHRVIYTRDIKKLCRTMVGDTPDKMYVENIIHPDKSKKLKDDEIYFNLKNYMDFLLSKQESIEEFRL